MFFSSFTFEGLTAFVLGDFLTALEGFLDFLVAEVLELSLSKAKSFFKTFFLTSGFSDLETFFGFATVFSAGISFFFDFLIDGFLSFGYSIFLDASFTFISKSLKIFI
jgi:hypothetical protein